MSDHPKITVDEMALQLVRQIHDMSPAALRHSVVEMDSAQEAMTRAYFKDVHGREVPEGDRLMFRGLPVFVVPSVPDLPRVVGKAQCGPSTTA